MNHPTLKDGMEPRFHASAANPFVSFLQMRRLRGSLLTATESPRKRANATKNPQRK